MTINASKLDIPDKTDLSPYVRIIREKGWERMQSYTDAAIVGNPGMSDLSDMSTWSQFMAHGQDVQIDPFQVRPGDVLLIAPKSDVKVGSKPHRLIARYSDIIVQSSALCVVEGEWHSMSVCTRCIQESWLWDHLFRNVRTLRNFAHATARAYDYFGCRCDPCTQAHLAYLGPSSGVPYAEPVPRLGHQKI